MNKFYIVIPFFLINMVIFALSAHAENFGIQNAVKQQIRQIQDQIKNIRTETKLNTQTVEENFSAKRTELEQRKNEFEDKITAERNELRNRIETKRQELKTKLANIKNERKRQVVEKIDISMDELNDRMVNHFTQVLNQIEEILKRIGERADRTQERRLDVSAVRVALDEAVAAIKLARTAIEVQAGKTYSIDVTDEATLKNKVGEARQLLHNDLSAVKEAVRAAHEAARKAAVTLAQIIKPSPTNSPQASPSVSPTPTINPSPTPEQ